MTKVAFYLLDVDYTDTWGPGNKGVIRLFGRTPDGKRVCVFDDRFAHYFWVIPQEKNDVQAIKEKILALKIKESQRVAYATDVTIHQKKYLARDTDALKVSVNNPKDINVLLSSIKHLEGVAKCLETDIPFHRRYLTDMQFSSLVLCEVEGEDVESNYRVDYCISAETLHQVEGEIIKEPRILAFDIESYNQTTPNEEKDPAIMISFYGTDDFKKTLVWKSYENPKEHVQFVDDEGAMLIAFKDIIQEFKPDYLVGYFSDGFDMPYLRARADKYKIKLDIGIDRSAVRFTRRADSTRANIIGFSHVDIFKFIRRVMGDTLNVSSFSLDTVSKTLLGEGKKDDIALSEMYKAWNAGGKPIEAFCDYNLQDAELTYKLTVLMLPHLNEFVKLVGLPIDEVARMGYGQLVENYILRELKTFNEIAPNRPYFDEINRRQAESYEGAFVHTPKPGLYKEIVVFDFKSLYPTIISAHNICPSTLTETGEHAHQAPAIKKKGDDVHYHFTHKHEGIFPKIVKEILIRRNRVKEMMKGEKRDPVLYARQYSLKILANSFYGYFGFAGARWYSHECAAAITSYGRNYIQQVIEQAEKEDFTVLYGDTDSVFIAIGKEKTRNDVLRFLEETNRELPSLMELELEGFYPRGLFVMKKTAETGAKKKYALLDEAGDIKVTGFETIRGDWSDIAKDVQSEVLAIILRQDDVQKAIQYVKDMLKKIQQKEIDVKKMVIKKRLKKEIADYEAVGPHVSVAKKLRERGEYVAAGSDIRYVILPGKGKIGERAVPADEAQDYDAEYYVNNQIIPAIERIFDVVGYHKEDLTGEHTQTSLGEFQ